eukprot:scaffold209993_cov19-Tisochrysis_lutea.AAC.3
MPWRLCSSSSSQLDMAKKAYALRHCHSPWVLGALAAARTAALTIITEQQQQQRLQALEQRAAAAEAEVAELNTQLASLQVTFLSQVGLRAFMSRTDCATNDKVSNERTEQTPDLIVPARAERVNKDRVCRIWTA